MGRSTVAVVVMGAALARMHGNALAQDAPADAPASAPDAPAVTATPVADERQIQIHGFVSEGAFVSTANNYIGQSSRGSVDLFEAALNVSTEVSDRLRFGFQLYGRDMGDLKDLPPRIDWAYFDYKWKPWLGLRGGIIKMPFGLYNEYEDIDASRISILLPQSLYSLRTRSALIAHTGFSLYGNAPLADGDDGELDYQVWLGTLNIPANALVLSGATLDRADDKYVTGAQVFWETPIDGLKVGGSFVRTSIDYDLTLSATTVQAVIMAGLAPADFTGKISIAQRPTQLFIGSVEYLHDEWQLAAEYARSQTHQESSIPDLIPPTDNDAESFYAMAAYRPSPHYAVGAYYSVTDDPDDRAGRNAMKYPLRYRAFQRDAAATIRVDINDHWLWKLEGHFIDGAADLDPSFNPMPTRYWGLFLLKTTVSF